MAEQPIDEEKDNTYIAPLEGLADYQLHAVRSRMSNRAGWQVSWADPDTAIIETNEPYEEVRGHLHFPDQAQGGMIRVPVTSLREEQESSEAVDQYGEDELRSRLKQANAERDTLEDTVEGLLAQQSEYEEQIEQLAEEQEQLREELSQARDKLGTYEEQVTDAETALYTLLENQSRTIASREGGTEHLAPDVFVDALSLIEDDDIYEYVAERTGLPTDDVQDVLETGFLPWTETAYYLEHHTSYEAAQAVRQYAAEQGINIDDMASTDMQQAVTGAGMTWDEIAFDSRASAAEINDVIRRYEAARDDHMHLLQQESQIREVEDQYHERKQDATRIQQRLEDGTADLQLSALYMRGEDADNVAVPYGTERGTLSMYIGTQVQDWLHDLPDDRYDHQMGSTTIQVAIATAITYDPDTLQERLYRSLAHGPVPMTAEVVRTSITDQDTPLGPYIAPELREKWETVSGIGPSTIDQLHSVARTQGEPDQAIDTFLDDRFGVILARTDRISRSQLRTIIDMTQEFTAEQDTDS